ncbi:MAG: hypothetical protein AB1345_02065 [Chloroflexota bacterium]
MNDYPFIPGKIPITPEPLSRFLPPIPEGVAASWLEAHLPAGSLVLDPFGTSPRLVAEAARMGYRVIVAANNPVSHFLIEMAASPPQQDELRTILAQIAATRKENQRLELHILSLYATRCKFCSTKVIAEAFVWKRGATTPHARLYTCPHCGDRGESPTTEDDENNAARFAASGLHKARALEYLTPFHDPDRKYAESALEIYLPRAIYTLVTLINKVEGLNLNDTQRRLANTLLLYAFDQASSLWTHPTGRERPLQLSLPPQFREHNIWFALEKAVNEWSSNSPPIKTSHWPELPPEGGGISIYNGRLRDLAPRLDDLPINASLTALPRPNQAYWTLSVIWAGWLWGKKAITPIKNVLRRRRYDWAWHTSALSAVWGHLLPHLPPDTLVFGVVAETEPSFLCSTLLSANIANLHLSGMAVRNDYPQAQITWMHKPQVLALPKREPRVMGVEAVLEILRKRGEPAQYTTLHAAILKEWAQQGQVAAHVTIPHEKYTETQNQCQAVISSSPELIRFEEASRSIEVGLWWLVKPTKTEAPLFDRLEESVLRLLETLPGIRSSELDARVCQEFPGLLTPSRAKLLACLESYGVQQPEDSDEWQLRAEDSPRRRETEKKELMGQLKKFGTRLGFQTKGTHPLNWMTSDGDIIFSFYLISTAIFANILFHPQSRPSQSLIVLPGGRANLVAYKLQTNPYLTKVVDQGWRFLKFRHLRRLMASPTLSRANLDHLFGLDPLTYTKPQIPLLL